MKWFNFDWTDEKNKKYNEETFLKELQSICDKHSWELVALASQIDKCVICNKSYTYGFETSFYECQEEYENNLEAYVINNMEISRLQQIEDNKIAEAKLKLTVSDIYLKRFIEKTESKLK